MELVYISSALMYLVYVNIVCSLFCFHVAKEKDRSSYNWFMMGLFFGPIALIAIAGLPVKYYGGKRTCPDCWEIISSSANCCPHCGFRFD